METMALRTPMAATTVKVSNGLGVKRVVFEAPWLWLAAGWRDLWDRPVLSLFYGAVFAFAALGLCWATLDTGWQSVVPALAGGFLLVGPMLAVGLYENSRRLEAGVPLNARDILLVGVRSPGQLALVGVGLCLLYFAWVLVAFLLFALFVGPRPLPPPEDFVPTLLFTARGLGLLITGTIAGGLLAAVVFVLTAVSVPLLTANTVDAVTAVGISVTAVKVNWRPMALWAVLIAGLIALGFVSLLVGLIVVFPLIGHATWHAYRDLVSVEPDGKVASSAG